MPGRIIPLVNEQIYHVFNRGIDHRPTFIDKKEFQRALTVLSYYRFSNPPVKLSKFFLLSNENRERILSDLNNENKKLVEILCFCLMPNHFHLLLKQVEENGISKYLSNIQNSYTRYFNTKNERVGPLFLGQFKAVRIQTDEQLLHVSRYIHLNPVTSYVVKDFKKLQDYLWSSLKEYLDMSNFKFCSREPILTFFNRNSDYKKFLEDQVAYQRELHKIKHLILE